jgi:hypothetical protein
MLFALTITAALATLGSAHPGEDHHDEIEQQRSFLANIERSSLRHCAETLKARGVTERNVKRRVALIEEARQKRKLNPSCASTTVCIRLINDHIGGIKKRDLDDVLNTDHNKTTLGYTPNTPADILFAGQNSCVLTPEVTLGPYCKRESHCNEGLILTLVIRRQR